MQGEGAVGIVRIRVHPLVGHRRIVDRKQLQHGLARLRRPVGHGHQVVELAHAEVVLAPQRKHWNGRSRSAETLPVKLRHGMLAQEAVAARGHVVPRVAERRLAALRGPAVMPPLLARDDPVTHDLIGVIQQHGARELVDLDGPKTALAVLHGIFPALADEEEILAPLRMVLDGKSGFHNKMRLVSKVTAALCRTGRSLVETNIRRMSIK